MATYCAEIDSPKGREDVFEYMATFSNAREWDPGVTGAESLTPGPPEVGSVFRLDVRVAGRTVPFDYRVLALERPTKVVLQAKGSGVVSTDTITVEPRGAGSHVRYVAVLEGTGLFRLAGPLIGRSFAKMADRGAAGLRRALA